VPRNVPLDPNVLVTNILLALAFVILLAVTSEIFNSSIDEHREEVEAFTKRLTRGPLLLLLPVARLDAWLDGVSERGRGGAILHALAILLLTGLIYGALSPDYGFNLASVILVLALMTGVGLMTYVQKGGRAILQTRRYGAKSTVRLYGTAVFVALGCVVASRLINFAPGAVYGFIASTLVLVPAAMSRRSQASVVLLPMAVMLALGIVAAVLLGPVAAAASADKSSWLLALLQTILSVVLVCGVEGAFFSLLPLTFLDGATVKAWSRVGWAIAFGVTTFLLWQLLLNPHGAYYQALQQTNVVVAMIILTIFIIVSGSTWLYFRFRDSARKQEAEA
jgi:hypothetical protein